MVYGFISIRSLIYTPNKRIILAWIFKRNGILFNTKHFDYKKSISNLFTCLNPEIHKKKVISKHKKGLDGRCLASIFFIRTWIWCFISLFEL